MSLEKLKSLIGQQFASREKGVFSPVEREWRICQELLAERPNDQFYRVYITNLEMAQRLGLEGEHIVASCFDLAITRDPFFAEEERAKIEIWEKKRRASLTILRLPRTIPMQLYPLYFEAILEGKKPFEGRAYDPESEKRYESIRPGDQIIFTVCRETADWQPECVRLNFDPQIVMKVKVKRVLFAPRVHWMYSLSDVVGAEFQPMIQDADSELLQLQRAAVYYSLPGYPEKIREHGFVGIEIEDPKIVR